MKSTERPAGSRSKAARRKPARRKPERTLVAKATIKARPGRIWILATEAGVREIRLSDREAPNRAELKERGWKLVRRPRWTERARHVLEEYLAGRARSLDFPLDLGGGTPFQRRVWEAARRIPYGAVASYADLARLAGGERAQRAVGNALGANPVPIIVPCHRVIHSDRSLGGFSSGIDWKRYLLELEQGQLAIAWKPRRRFLFGR